ncbi:uncharacterized protein LOC120344556 [Styela clava]
MKHYAIIIFGISCMSVVICQTVDEDNIKVDDIQREVLKVLAGDEFKNHYYMAEKEHLKKVGNCIETKGPNAKYDLEQKECFICSDDKCSGNPACMAQCRDTMRISELEIENRSLRAVNSDLYFRSDISFLIMGAFLVLGVGLSVAVTCIWLATRCDKANHPDGDLHQSSSENLPKYSTPNSRDDLGAGRAFLPNGRQEQSPIEENTV